MFRVVISRRKCPHRCKTRDRHRSDRTFGTAADHRVCIAAFNDAKTVADSMSSGRTRCCGRRIRPLGTVPYRHIARCEIYNGRNDKEWRNTVRARIEQFFMLAFDRPEISDTGTDIGSDHFRVRLVDNEAAVLHRFVRSGECKMRERSHSPGFFLIQKV